MKYIILVGNRQFIYNWEKQILDKIKKHNSQVHLIVGNQIETNKKSINFSAYYFFKFIEKVIYFFLNNGKKSELFEKLFIKDLDYETEFVKVDNINGRDEITGYSKTYENQIVIRLGFGILSESTIKTFGGTIYSLHHGDIINFRGGPVGFWEMVKNEKRANITLQVINEHLDSGEVVFYGSILLNEFSYYKSLDLIYGKGIDLYYELIESLLEEKLVPSSKTSFLINPIKKRPHNFLMIKILLNLYSKKFYYAIFKLYYEVYWEVYIRKKPKSGRVISFENKFRISSTNDRYYADPYIFKKYLFVEDYCYKKQRGLISVLDLSGKIIKYDLFSSDSHRSFPQVIEYKNKVLIMTESQELNSVEVYRLNISNWSLSLEFKLSNTSIVDPVFIINENLYILGCKRMQLYGSADDKLVCYKINDSNENYNIKKINVNTRLPIFSRRPASGQINSNNMFFQYNKDKYGQSIILAKFSIDQNGFNVYSEAVPMTFEENNGQSQVEGHTYNESHEYITYDRRKYIPRWKKYI